MSNLFEGYRVRLRAVEPEDWQVHHAWDAQAPMGRQTDEVWLPNSTLQAQKWAREQAETGNHGDNIRLQIEALDSGELVGTLDTHDCDPRNGTFMYGIAIRPEYQRRGYAREAIRLLLRYYFNERRYQKVVIDVYSFNMASIALHESLGFVQEGRLRRMMYTRGEYFDLLVYGLTREEFDTLHADELPDDPL